MFGIAQQKYDKLKTTWTVWQEILLFVIWIKMFVLYPSPQFGLSFTTELDL